MAQGWFTKFISMSKWIRTSRLSIKNSLSASAGGCLAAFAPLGLARHQGVALQSADTEAAVATFDEVLYCLIYALTN